MHATVTLDKAGRFVVPKAIRDQLKLRGGSKLRLNVIDDRIELSEEESEARVLRKRNGLRVVGWEGFDAAKAVREMREEQVARLEAPFRKK